MWYSANFIKTDSTTILTNPPTSPCYLRIYILYMNWAVSGSGFRVKRLQAIDTVHGINQNLAYPSYPIEWNGLIARWRHTPFGMMSGFFQPGTLNPEPLNLLIHTSNVHPLAIKNIVNVYIYFCDLVSIKISCVLVLKANFIWENELKFEMN